MMGSTILLVEMKKFKKINKDLFKKEMINVVEAADGKKH